MPPVVSQIDLLRGWLDDRRAKRVLVVTGKRRRFLDRLLPVLDGLTHEIFDGAEVHVPRDVVSAAQVAVESFEPDVAIALGGGSATGLAKALALESDLPFAAVPTTYSGSEMTNIYGIRSDSAKKTGRDDRVRPQLIVHDVELFRGMPRRLTATSLMNAVAHAISALSTGKLDGDLHRVAVDAVVGLAEALAILVAEPEDRGAIRQALEGVARSAGVLDAGTLGEHHLLAHHFGGRLGADHSGLHACLLPHTLAALLRARPAIADTLVQRTGDRNLPGSLFGHLVRVGAATSLRELAETAEAADAAAAELADLGLSAEALASANDALLGRDPTEPRAP